MNTKTCKPESKSEKKSVIPGTDIGVGEQFEITFYSKKAGETIVRLGCWTDKCRVFVTKSGKSCITYYQLERGESDDGYRTATNEWKIQYAQSERA